MSRRSSRRSGVVLAVTARQSLGLMRGFPEYLADGGWDVHVVVGESAPAYREDITLDVVPMRRDPSLPQDALAVVAWIRLLQRLRPAVVVAGTPKAGLLGMIAATVCRVPVRVYMLRGLRLSTESHALRRVLFATEWIAARCATHVLAVSESLRQEFVDARLARAEKVVVLGSGSSNGVDLAAFTVARDDRPADSVAPTIGFVGRICADKGLDVLVRAWGLVRERGQDCRLLLVGPDEGSAELDEALAEVPGGTVTRPGRVDDVASWYAAMDVLCLPSKREGFPNVVLEAAAMGLPTVASRVTGCVDAVVDGETGLLAEQDDPAEFADRLYTLVTDQARAREMGRAARARVEREFDRHTVWERTDRYLRDLVQPTALHETKQVS